MVDGPGGMWYRAAKFKSKQECMNFISYIKTMLAQRSNVDDDFVTISFENPQGDKFVACMGFPEVATKIFAETLFGNAPEVVLSSQDIEFARQAIVDLRRDQGISDAESAAYAKKRLEELKAPAEAVKVIMDAYEETEQRHRQELLAKRPFINVYLETQCKDIDRLAYEENPYTIVPGTEVVADVTKKLIRRNLNRADRYMFDNSARTMLYTVRDPDVTTWIPLERNLFLWFTEPISTDGLFGDDVKGLWVHNMDSGKDIDEFTSAARDSDAYEALMNRNEKFKTFWSFDIVTSDGEELFDFTYDKARKRFVHPASHKCPWDLCDYPIKGDLWQLGLCVLCPRCAASLDYWSSVLHTAIRIIHREYALAPEEPKPFPEQKATWEEEAMIMVGKGKNKKRIRKTVRREVEYRFVSFEVSELSTETRRRAKEALEGEEKKGNWITWAEEGDVIWEYRPIDVSRGRTYDPERNPRWKEHKHIEVKPFKKWVAMYSKERKTVKRVTARRFQEDK